MKIFKKICFFISASAFMSIFISCASVPLVKEDYSPCVLMTVYGNTTLPLYEDNTNISDGDYKIQPSSEGFLTGLFTKATDKENPELTSAQQRIDDSEHILRSNLEVYGFEVIERETVQQTEGYKGIQSSFMTMITNTKSASGYEILKSVKSAKNQEVLSQTGARSLVYASFTFQKQYISSGYEKLGIGPRVELSVYVINSENKITREKTYTGTTSEYAKLYDGIYDKEELVSLYYDAIENAVIQFVKDFQ